jgi:hypothetical protein
VNLQVDAERHADPFVRHSSLPRKTIRADTATLVIIRPVRRAQCFRWDHNQGA